jgi:hypothetical protein
MTQAECRLRWRHKNPELVAAQNLRSRINSQERKERERIKVLLGIVDLPETMNPEVEHLMELFGLQVPIETLEERYEPRRS